MLTLGRITGNIYAHKYYLTTVTLTGILVLPIFE